MAQPALCRNDQTAGHHRAVIAGKKSDRMIGIAIGIAAAPRQPQRARGKFLGRGLIVKRGQRLSRLGLPRRHQLRHAKRSRRRRFFGCVDKGNGRVGSAQVDAHHKTAGLVGSCIGCRILRSVHGTIQFFSALRIFIVSEIPFAQLLQKQFLAPQTKRRLFISSNKSADIFGYLLPIQRHRVAPIAPLSGRRQPQEAYRA